MIRQPLSKTAWLYGAIGFILVLLAVYFRLYPLLSHASSEAREKATLLVISKLKKTAADQIQNSQPSLSAEQKFKATQDSFNILLRNQSRMVKLSIDKLARDIDRNLPNSQRYPYLLEADPYNYFGLTENIVTTGAISDSIQGSKFFNKFMLAPEGHWEPFTLHPYVGYALYRIVSFFDANIPLMFAVSFTPVMIALLCLFPYLFLITRLGCSPAASLAGVAFLFLSPIFLERSAFGWYDNDPYNILFPLLVLNALLLGLHQLHRPKNYLFSAALSGFLIGIYALFWQGWVYLLAIILISGLVIVGYCLFILKSKEKALTLLGFGSATVLFGFCVVSAVFGAHDFFILFSEGWNALKFFLSPQFTPWPDLFINVGELRRATLADIVKMTGGWIFLAAAVFGLLTSLLKIRRENNQAKSFMFIVIAVFFVFTIFITLGARRFALLALIPMSLLIPLGLQNLYVWLEKYLNTQTPDGLIRKLILQLGVFAAATGMLVVLCLQAHETILAWRPIYNETWDKSMQDIKDGTPPDSIINSWWPPGHFLKTMAKRRVTFDGATINRPQAYWMANLLLSPDEKYAAGIIRMLNISANQAVDYLQQEGLKLSEAVKIIQAIAPLSRQNAKLKLLARLTQEQTEKLLTLTHGTPPPSYLFLYNDLIEKILELSFVGRWDFGKIEKLSSDPTALKNLPSPHSPEYIRFLWQSVGGPLHSSEPLAEISRKGNLIEFPDNIVVNLSEKSCVLSSEKFGSGVPRSLVFLNPQTQLIEEKLFTNAGLPFSVFLYEDNGYYRVIVLDRKLALSVIFRLYFLEGKGLQYFEPFASETDLTRRTKIVVYRINWDKLKQSVAPEP